LIALWPDHSIGQIAALLGVSKSMVSGEVYRLREHGVRLVSKRRGPLENMQHTLSMKAKVRISPPPSMNKPCRLTELRDDDCRWPLDTPGMFCGAVVDGRGSYCAQHRRTARV
jgi:hypothetical protein